MLKYDALALPHSFDEFTAEWFEQILSDEFPGVRIASIRSSDQRVGTSASCRFDLTYAAPGSGPPPPPSVYVKGGFTEAQRKRYWMVLQQEARFYEWLAKDIPMPIPRHFFAGVDDHQQGIVVLEDLALRKVTFGFWGGLSVDQVAALLERAAAMHAQWLGDPRLPKLAGWETPQRGFLKYCIRDKHWEHLLSRSYGDLLKAAGSDSQRMRDALDRMWANNDACPRTFVHGDLHGWNTIFDADGTPGAIDFQLCFAGAPIHDVSWLIVSGLTIEDRRAEEGALLRHYRKAAVAAGLDLPDDDALWLMHRQQMAHAIVSGACGPIESGPLDAIDAAARVTLTAAIDLDPLEALGIVR